MNFRDLSRNCLASDKALYDGHAVAAVAATSSSICDEALDLIEVEYEILPHVIDVEAAMADGRADLARDLFTQGVEPKPTKPFQHRKRIGFAKGNIDEGFAAADVVIERRYTTQPVHQAYIEPHACVRRGYVRRAMHDLELEPGPVHWSAPIAPNCSAPTSPISARWRPRSAAGSAARRWSISSPWRSPCRKNRGGRSRW